jgi:hypothetical protein
MEENANSKWMPRYLKCSIQLMNFEIEELSVFVMSCCLFLILKSKWWILIAFLGYYAVKKIKAKYPNGILYNWAYVTGVLEMEGLPPGLSKEFIE